MAVNLNGIFPACVTPFDTDGYVAPKRFAANVARWERAGLHGYLVLGSTGEFQYLDEMERGKVLEAARQISSALGGNVHLRKDHPNGSGSA